MSTATSDGLRAANRASVLGALVRRGELSRAELADACGLSAATVATVVSELLHDGFAEERSRVPSHGGRPITRLGPRPDGAHLLGAEVGEGGVVVELLDLSLRHLDDEHVPLGVPDPNPVEVAAALRRGLRTVRSRNPAAEASLAGIGLALPDGLLGSAPAQVLVEMLAEPGRARAVPVHAAGHAAALAAAEAWRGPVGDGPPGNGPARSVGRTLVAALGRDAGLAVVAHGRLDPERGDAGSWGHTTVVPNGRGCACGRRGCLQAYVGADALVEAWRARGGTPTGTGPEALAALVAAADAGEAGAVTALDMALELLAIALGNAVTLTGVGAVVVGGPVGDVLVRARGAALAGRVRTATAAPGADVLSVTGRRAAEGGAFGAALVVLDRLLASPGLARGPVGAAPPD